MWWIMPIDKNERLENSLQDLHTHFYSFLTHESPIQQLLYYLKFKIMICWVNKLMHPLVYFLQNIGSFLCKVSCWFPQTSIVEHYSMFCIFLHSSIQSWSEIQLFCLQSWMLFFLVGNEIDHDMRLFGKFTCTVKLMVSWHLPTNAPAVYH